MERCPKCARSMSTYTHVCVYCRTSPSERSAMPATRPEDAYIPAPSLYGPIDSPTVCDPAESWNPPTSSDTGSFDGGGDFGGGGASGDF